MRIERSAEAQRIGQEILILAARGKRGRRGERLPAGWGCSTFIDKISIPKPDSDGIR